MVQVSRFYGIVISMYHREHNPPHFHAAYGEHEAIVRINDFGLHEWSLPPKALALVIERAMLHQSELLQNRENIEWKKEILTIASLE